MTEYKTINPSNGEELELYRYFSDREIDKKLELAHSAFTQWKNKKLDEKLPLMERLKWNLLSRKEELAHLIALEMGKPIREGISEVEKCANLCSFYIDNAEKFLAPEIVKTECRSSFVSFEPLGAIFAIMPWNFPYWQVFRFCIPSLLAGNTVVLKHAPNVTGCSIAIEKLFVEAAFPDGVFSSVLATVEQASKIIESPYIKGVTLTGSCRAGRAVASKAGECLKKCVIELGGSDPYIILEDADLEKASDICIKSRMFNSGQTCISAKRFIVDRKVEKQFVELLMSKLQKIKFGDPLDKQTSYGPMARADLRVALQSQVEQSKMAGARCLLGGTIPKGNGFFYMSTVLDKVTADMKAFKEETFGPVFSIISAKDEKDAVELANQTVFGLGAAVFTKNLEKGIYIAKEKLNAGTCVVNDLVRSDPRFPFGGINESGFGRELSYYGMREFQNIKTVYTES
ncbi:MAG TPA: succinate-semialdehyde dehydrogenase [Lentisphaeria bacterium]|nr:MAG: succinate-semialdehyde dehydrogenase [Lentisphaerae bacterium GWF2_38_69]HBM17122.1 succinate-semialdehyde dehydrogenase [Lentisphaeria bacterium]